MIVARWTRSWGNLTVWRILDSQRRHWHWIRCWTRDPLLVLISSDRSISMQVERRKESPPSLRKTESCSTGRSVPKVSRVVESYQMVASMGNPMEGPKGDLENMIIRKKTCLIINRGKNVTVKSWSKVVLLLLCHRFFAFAHGRCYCWLEQMNKHCKFNTHDHQGWEMNLSFSSVVPAQGMIVRTSHLKITGIHITLSLSLSFTDRSIIVAWEESREKRTYMQGYARLPPSSIGDVQHRLLTLFCSIDMHRHPYLLSAS